MSATFTPGPWLIEPQGKGARGHWFQREGDGEYIAMSCKLKDQAEEDANARLIAAAPEIYEALAALLDAAERHIFGDECLSQRNAARAVLRQARGEASV